MTACKLCFRTLINHTIIQRSLIRKCQALEQEAANWAKAQQLRAYLAALKEMLIAKQGEIQQGSKADQWLGWAYQHADRLDPLVSE
jgi:DNA topoisomerase IB